MKETDAEMKRKRECLEGDTGRKRGRGGERRDIGNRMIGRGRERDRGKEKERKKKRERRERERERERERQGEGGRERERERRGDCIQGRDRMPRLFVNYFFMLVFLYIVLYLIIQCYIYTITIYISYQ